MWTNGKQKEVFKKYINDHGQIEFMDYNDIPSADGVSIESLMNDYYGFGLNHRVDMFCVSDSISYDTVCDYTFVNGIDGTFKKEYNFSDLDRKKCANAFIRYLNTNYHQSIEEGSLD